MAAKVATISGATVRADFNAVEAVLHYTRAAHRLGLWESERTLIERFFDPALYRIVTFDQRGCGRSTPHACLEHNDTWALVEDMEHIRQQLGIERWVLFGGSWGSTLSLAYAQRHPERVQALILRGIFLCRPEDFRWFYQEGASRLFPDYWQDYLAVIP